MTASTDALVCGCIRGVAHWPGCPLGQAEQIATTAATSAARPGPRLVVALAALADAGLLCDPAPADLVEDLECLLDTLWEMGLLAHPAAADGAAGVTGHGR